VSGVSWAAALSVGIGGGLGSIARYLVGVWVLGRLPYPLPLGTLIVNVLGSFLIGLIAELAVLKAFGVTSEIRMFLVVGVLGGFTTFSSLALEMTVLVRGSEWWWALLYSAGSVVVGLGAAFAGIALAKLLAPA